MTTRLAGLGAGLLLVAGATLSLGPGMAFAAGGDAPPGHSAEHEAPGQARKAADAAQTDASQPQASVSTDSAPADSQPPGQAKRDARAADAGQGAAQAGTTGPAAPASASPASAGSDTPPSTGGRSGNAGGHDKAADGDGGTSQGATSERSASVSAASSSTGGSRASKHQASHHGATKSHGSTSRPSSGAGPLDQPQPLSNADQNSGGANGQCPGGPYCSTRDGSPSGNGNGNGKATGKPCAGCVGKADNKNPKGQMPNGSDHNNGYECDGNHGIGRSNPAHTGCQPAPACVPTAANNNCQPPPTCIPTAANNNCQPAETCVPAAGEDENCAAVEGTKFGSTPPAQASTVPAATEAGTLPHTGAQLVSSLLTIGLFLLALGAALVISGRRRRSTT